MIHDFNSHKKEFFFDLDVKFFKDEFNLQNQFNFFL